MTDGPGTAIDPLAILRAAHAARRAGATAGFNRILEAYRAARPAAAPALLAHGWACWAAGFRQEAEDAFRDAARADPQAPWPRVALAQAARHAGRVEQARAMLAAVLADHPGHAGAMLEEAVLARAEGEAGRARALIEALVDRDPGFVGARLEQAAILREAGDAPGAEAALRHAVAADPANPWARLELGRVQRAQGRAEEAMEAFRAAARIDPGLAAPAVEQARTLLDDARPAEALALLEQARRTAPEEPWLRLLHAEALRALRRRGEALAVLAPAEADPRFAVVAAIDRAALERAARFRPGAAPGARPDPARMARALAGATAQEVATGLAHLAYQAHPFDAVAAAGRVLDARREPDVRLAAVMAEAEALGTAGLQQRALARLETFAAEAGRLPAPLDARLSLRRGHALLSMGRRAAAAAAFARAGAAAPDDPAAGALCALVEEMEAGFAPEACLRLLSDPGLSGWPRAFVADRAAARLSRGDARLALAGIGVADRRVAEPLLRRNLALAQGHEAEARAILQGIFAAQGLEGPQPEGARAGIDAFACPPAAPVEGPLVSVVVSAFDAAATLAGALESIRAQSWRNLEILVVDDASTDGTGAVIAAAAAADPRIRPLANQRNAGTYASRNLAIAAARGDYVTFHDSDDWMHPRRIETEMAAFEDQGVAAVNSASCRMDASGRVLFWPRRPPTYANPSFIMFRRTALVRLGCYDPVRASADTEMFWRARLVFGMDAVALLPRLLTISAARPGSLTTDAGTGMDPFGFNPRRLVYHEAFAGWHLACDLAGVAPHVAPGGPPPSHLQGLPEGMAAGEPG